MHWSVVTISSDEELWTRIYLPSLVLWLLQNHTIKLRTYVPISAGALAQRRQFINSAISKFMLMNSAKQNGETTAACDLYRSLCYRECDSALWPSSSKLQPFACSILIEHFDSITCFVDILQWVHGQGLTDLHQTSLWFFIKKKNADGDCKLAVEALQDSNLSSKCVKICKSLGPFCS